MDRSTARVLAAASRTRAVVWVCGAYAVLGGLVSLLGWVVDVPRLTDWGGNGISIQPNTTLAATSAGLALLGLASRRRWLTRASAAVVLGLGAATLAEHAFGVDLWIDQLLPIERSWGGTATVATGRMGLPASAAWTLLGLSLLLATRAAPRARAATALALVALGISALGVVGYGFGADRLYAAPRLTAIALQTATMVFATAAGVLAAHPERQPVRRLVEDGAAGRLTRRALPFLVGMPIVLGLLRVMGQDAGWYDTAFGTSALVLVLIALLVLVQWWSTSTIADYEIRLRDDKQRLSDTLESISDQFQVIDGDWRCVYHNGAQRRALAAHGVDPDAALGRPVFELFPELEGTDAARSLQRAMSARERTECEFFYGPWQRWYAMRAAPTPDGGLAVLLQDTTTRHEAEAERERLLESERQARGSAERLNSVKDEFLATLSHELRTPLNSILGWSHILRVRPPAGDTLAQGLEIIERNARAQAQLVSDLLDMSRIVSGKMRLQVDRVDLPRIVEAALDAVRPAAQAKGVVVHSALEPLRHATLGDPDRLQQVVWNLVSNAVKFTSTGGRVDVVLARTPTHVQLTVRDTGKGMSAEFLPHVFERFRQADSSSSRAHGGLGLGLAIVKQLVELHGGRVRAASDGDGAGSTFVVELPFAALPSTSLDGDLHRRAPAPAEAPPEYRPVALEGLRVLIVDDDRDALVLVRRMLEECRAEVRQASSSRDALAVLRDFSADVVVSDIGMPQADGYAFLQQARAAGCTAPAIALTAFARPDDQARALSVGYQRHLSKPVEPAELIAAVVAVLNREIAAR